MAKTVAELSFPDDLKYTDEHIWVRKDGEEIVIGVSDYAQDQLGEVVYVDLPSEGDSFAAGDEFGEVESIKSVNKLFMPVAGEVSAVNGDLDGTPTLLNASCYDRGWLIRVKPEDMASVDGLLSADVYKATL
ncbi:glycine cleavage system protein GcvH [uncultured Mailhella sp.]|uniref:glycine cleavage system protein GcvH n=1 Tax=uncultured Mailhella sp. TaxID=1981031 RepID=UPI0025FFFD78|nr:glycine cleavage system protein GcvH [uncultured Mailhella sp.]